MVSWPRKKITYYKNSQIDQSIKFLQNGFKNIQKRTQDTKQTILQKRTIVLKDGIRKTYKT